MLDTESLTKLRRFYDELSGSGEALVAAFGSARGDLIDEDIEWIESFGTLQGAEAVLQGIFRGHTQAFDELFFTAETIFPTRDTAACVVGQSGGRMKNGAELNGTFVHFWEFEDGRGIRMSAFNEDGVMQRALGLDPGAGPEETMQAFIASLSDAS
jgi:ketosteroid isomerase-like protein